MGSGLQPTLPVAVTMPVTSSSEALVSLPNLGPRSQDMLKRAGITRVSQLRRLGSVASFLRVKQVNPSASLNLLWALEGALSGKPWREVSRDDRTRLLLAVDDLTSDRR